MNETAPPPANQLLDTLNYAAGGLEWALWPAVGCLAVLWLFGRLVKVTGRFPADSLVAKYTPEITAVIGYLIISLIAVTLLINFAAFFVENTVWSWVPRYAGQ